MSDDEPREITLTHRARPRSIVIRRDSKDGSTEVRYVDEAEIVKRREQLIQLLEEAKLWTLHPHLHAKLADDILDLLLGES